MKRKSQKNMKTLQEKVTPVWHDLRSVDLSNGDRKRFTDWIADLFL